MPSHFSRFSRFSSPSGNPGHSGLLTKLFKTRPFSWRPTALLPIDVLGEGRGMVSQVNKLNRWGGGGGGGAWHHGLWSHEVPPPL